MKWITRERVHVDRVACPWLIRRFIDPQAEFLFAPAKEVLSKANEEGATPFDTVGATLHHRGDRCTFDALIEDFRLDDPALQRLAVIVRAADTRRWNLSPIAQGLEAIAQGFRLGGTSDAESLEKQFPLYDALYTWCREVGKD